MLNITVDINGQVLVALGVRRVRPTRGRPRPTTICCYVVTDRYGQLAGRLTHRYGDGASVLVQKVLAVVGDPCTPIHT
jgi:hypothetical protein